jgi:GNAT superfamily N-acetyltransferase
MDEEERDFHDPNGCGANLDARLSDRFSPLTHGADDVEEFARFELANWTAIRLGEDVDTAQFRDAAVRESFIKRALEPEDAPYLSRPFTLGRRLYWLTCNGKRVGTIGFRVVPASQRPTIEISDLFVSPQSRNRGLGAGALKFVRDAAFEVGIECVRLETEWSAQRSLRFYLKQSMWSNGWKRGLRMVFSKDLPTWHVQVERDQARFVSGERLLGVATNKGDRLGWQLGPDVDDSLRSHLEATAALQLAVMGWPLIRDDERWQRQLKSGAGDWGDHEVLAGRIRGFERHIKRKGWLQPATNPSFLSLPRFASVKVLRDRLQVQLSDGREYPMPFMLINVLSRLEPESPEHVWLEDGETIICTFPSGERDEVTVDEVLGYNTSPEHLAEKVMFWRKQRGEQVKAEARRKKPPK